MRFSIESQIDRSNFGGFNQDEIASQHLATMDSQKDNLTFDKSMISSSTTYNIQKNQSAQRPLYKNDHAPKAGGRQYQSPMSHAKSILNAYKQQQPLSRTKHAIPQDLATNIQRTLQQQQSQNFVQNQIQTKQLVNQYLEYERLNNSQSFANKNTTQLTDFIRQTQNEESLKYRNKDIVQQVPKHKYRSGMQGDLRVAQSSSELQDQYDQQKETPLYSAKDYLTASNNIVERDLRNGQEKYVEELKYVSNQSAKNKTTYQQYQDGQNLYNHSQLGQSNLNVIRREDQSQELLASVNDSLDPRVVLTQDFMNYPQAVNTERMSSDAPQYHQFKFQKDSSNTTMAQNNQSKNQESQSKQFQPIQESQLESSLRGSSNYTQDVKRNIKELNRLRAQADQSSSTSLNDQLNNSLYSRSGQESRALFSYNNPVRHIAGEGGGMMAQSHSVKQQSSAKMHQIQQEQSDVQGHKFKPSQDQHKQKGIYPVKKSKVNLQQRDNRGKEQPSSNIADREIKHNFQRIMENEDQFSQAQRYKRQPDQREDANNPRGYNSRAYEEQKIKEYISLNGNLRDGHPMIEQYSSNYQDQQMFNEYLMRDLSSVNSPAPRSLERGLSYPSHVSSQKKTGIEQMAHKTATHALNEMLARGSNGGSHSSFQDAQLNSQHFSPSSIQSRSHQPSQFGQHQYLQPGVSPPQQQFNVSGNAQIIFNSSHIDNSHSSMSIASPHTNILLTGTNSNMSLYPLMPQSVPSNVNLSALNSGLPPAGSSNYQQNETQMAPSSSYSRMFAHTGNSNAHPSSFIRSTQQNMSSQNLANIGNRLNHTLKQQQQNSNLQSTNTTPQQTQKQQQVYPYQSVLQNEANTSSSRQNGGNPSGSLRQTLNHDSSSSQGFNDLSNQLPQNNRGAYASALRANLK